jgi:hypothetical protein
MILKRNGTIAALAAIALLVVGCTTSRNRLTITSIQGAAAVDPERSATYTCNANDPAGEPLSYTWSCTAGYLSSTSGQAVSWTALDTPGTAMVTATVRNDLGDSDVQSRTIAINPPVSHLETAPAAMGNPAVAGQSPVPGNYEGPDVPDTGYAVTPVYPAESPDNAVENASSDNVEGYAVWAGPPSRAGWEKAARGTGGPEYRLGNAEPVGEQYGLGGNVGTLTPAGPYSPTPTIYGRGGASPAGDRGPGARFSSGSGAPGEGQDNRRERR